jgi:hypothetical protein
MRWNRTGHWNATVERDQPWPFNHVPAVYRRYPACSLETHHTGGEEVVNGNTADEGGREAADSRANALLSVPGNQPIAKRGDVHELPVARTIRW